MPPKSTSRKSLSLLAACLPLVLLACERTPGVLPTTTVSDLPPLVTSAKAAPIAKGSAARDVSLTIRWPSRTSRGTQVIPEDTNAITVRVTGRGTTQQKTILRTGSEATTQVAFSLFPGDYAVSVECLFRFAGQDRLLAQQLVDLTVSADQPVAMTIRPVLLPTPSPTPTPILTPTPEPTLEPTQAPPGAIVNILNIERFPLNSGLPVKVGEYCKISGYGFMTGANISKNEVYFTMLDVTMGKAFSPSSGKLATASVLTYDTSISGSRSLYLRVPADATSGPVYLYNPNGISEPYPLTMVDSTSKPDTTPSQTPEQTPTPLPTPKTASSLSMQRTLVPPPPVHGLVLLGEPGRSSLPYLGRLRSAPDGSVLIGSGDTVVRFDGTALSYALGPVPNVNFYSGSFCLMSGGNFLTGFGDVAGSPMLSPSNVNPLIQYYLKLVSPTGLSQSVNLGNQAAFPGMILDMIESDGGFLIATGNSTLFFKNSISMVDSRPNLGLVRARGRVYGFNSSEVFEVGGAAVANFGGGVDFRRNEGQSAKPICSWDDDTILVADQGILAIDVGKGAVSRVFSEQLDAVGMVRWRDSLLVSSRGSIQIID